MSKHVTSEGGFTLVELVVAMAVFSFMLLIITVGFINVVRMHNAAVASNVAQDNARTAIDEVVRAVRDSSGLGQPIAAAPAGVILCLAKNSGPQQVFYVGDASGTPYVAGGAVKVLWQADNCPVATRTNKHAITNGYVNMQFFNAVQRNSATVVKPQIDVSVTVASNNGTIDTGTSGATTTCANNSQARQFCSVVTLTSGAVPR